jgi:hypothetical protein
MVDRCLWVESLPAIHVCTIPSILYWIDKFLTAGQQQLLNLPQAFIFAIGLSKKQVQLPPSIDWHVSRICVGTF